MLLVELEDLAQLAVGGYDHLVAAGEVQVGQAAKVHAHSAVDAGGNVILEVLPQLRLFGVCLGAAVQQQEDVADGHHHGEVVEHIGPQTLFMLQGIQVLAVDHVLGDPQLLVHTADHHALVHALVCAADEVAVQVQIHIIHALDKGQGLVDKDVVHIEGVLGQHHAAVPQHLCAVHHRVHQQVLVGPEVADMRPVEQPVLGEHVGVAHGVAGVVLHMLVDIVADHQVRRGAPGSQRVQLGQHGPEGCFVQPVVAVHYLVVQAGGVANALIHALAVAAVLLMDGLDDGGIFGSVLVADGGGVILGGTIVHQDDLGLLPGGEQGLDAMAHIGRRVIARDGKGNEFLLHNNKLLIVLARPCAEQKMAGDGDMYSYYIIFAHKKLGRPANTFKKRQQKSILIPFRAGLCYNSTVTGTKKQEEDLLIHSRTYSGNM